MREISKPNGLPLMTHEAIAQACMEDSGYETPELNERLYLHFKGYQRIENLDKYTGCKALFLESNGLTKIENLEPVLHLRSLYLQQNLLTRIENIGHLKDLVTLNLSQNRLTKLSGLDTLPNLATLDVSKNEISQLNGINHLVQCPSLINVDLGANKLDDPEIIEVFKALPNLTALSIAGNPTVSNTRHFRKVMLNALPNLRYLDRPINETERVLAKAWQNGGKEAEKAARDAAQKSKRLESKKSLATYRAWQQEMRRKREAEIARIKAADPTATPSMWCGRPVQYSTMSTEEQQEIEDKKREADKKLRDMENAQRGVVSSTGTARSSAAASDLMTAHQEKNQRQMASMDEPVESAGNCESKPKPSVQWTPALDKQLSALVKSCTFDFGKVALALESQLGGPDECIWDVSATSCRLRFAEIKKRAKKGSAGSSSSVSSKSSETNKQTKMISDSDLEKASGSVQNLGAVPQARTASTQPTSSEPKVMKARPAVHENHNRTSSDNEITQREGMRMRYLQYRRVWASPSGDEPEQSMAMDKDKRRHNGNEISDCEDADGTFPGAPKGVFLHRTWDEMQQAVMTEAVPRFQPKFVPSLSSMDGELGMTKLRLTGKEPNPENAFKQKTRISGGTDLTGCGSKNGPDADDSNNDDNEPVQPIHRSDIFRELAQGNLSLGGGLDLEQLD